tara:strand:+ start:672 stop:1004 length:333 start_codon:yes stop_codon:yes gene_type:complete
VGIEVLAGIAAVATASAVVCGLMLRAARRDLGIYKNQAKAASLMAENATRTAERMQQALRVVSEEIATAKAERKAADKVIAKAEKVLATGEGLEGLADAWEDLIDRPGRS